MKNLILRIALVVVCATVGIIARATDITLPTPPPSSYPDSESTANVAVTNGTCLCRRVKLTLSADFTPSNGVQVAFGQDINSDGDLAPEETRVVFGVDCGEPFVREEFCRGRGQSLAAQFGQADDSLGGQGLTAAPGASTFIFAFKQPSAVTNRLTHAKVTTHNLADTNLVVTVELYSRGQVLFLR